MSLSGKRVKPRPDVLVRQMGDELVLLNLANESYFGLDEVGTAIWRALETEPSVDAACDSLTREYDVTPERLRSDVEALVARLAQAGLVEIHEI